MDYITTKNIMFTHEIRIVTENTLLGNSHHVRKNDIRTKLDHHIPLCFCVFPSFFEIFGHIILCGTNETILYH